jgi:hypothetical protein
VPRRFQTLSGAIGTPAAGAGFAYKFSAIQRVKLHSLKFTFSTSVAVANRLVWVMLCDPNGVGVFETGSAVAVAASSSSDYVVSPVFGNVVPMQGKTQAAVGLGWPDMWLPPSWSIMAGAVAEDVADQFSAITFGADFAEDVWHQDQHAAAIAAFLQTLS